MRRATQSFWIATAESKGHVPRFPQLGRAERLKTDVAVIGGGLFGMSCAMKLKQAGKRVILLEGGRIGRCASGNSTNKFSALHNITYQHLSQEKGRDYSQLNVAGIQQAAAWVAQFGIDCDFSYRTNYTYTRSEDKVETIKKEAKAAADAGLQVEFITETTDLPYDILAAVAMPGSAQMNTYAFLAALSQQFTSEGPDHQIFEDSMVQDVTWTTPHVVTTACGGKVEAEHVVIATQMPFTDRSQHFAFCPPKRSFCVAFRAKSGVKVPEGMWISAEEPTRSIRCAKDAEGNAILIVAGAGQEVGEEPGHDTRRCFDELTEFAYEHWGKENLEERERWSAMDYMPPDEIPYIGYLHRGTSTMYCGTGFKKWGLAACVGGAQLITDLVLGIENSWEHTFDARRWDLHPGTLVRLAATQVHVAKHLIGDRVHQMMHARDIEDLGRGCGDICKMKNGTKAACYRDDSGNVFAVSPACTHLGCRVLFNTAERSWDCPCHGSRFAFDGRVLKGPATKALKLYDPGTGEEVERREECNPQVGDNPAHPSASA